MKCCLFGIQYQIRLKQRFNSALFVQYKKRITRLYWKKRSLIKFGAMTISFTLYIMKQTPYKKFTSWSTDAINGNSDITRGPYKNHSAFYLCYDKTTRAAICFEHKTQYLLIRAPYTRIVVFWHISNIPPMISQSQISCNTPTFCIAAIFVKYCYTTGSWLL